MGRERSAFHPGPELKLQQRPNTFAQTNPPISFFACDKTADHTFRMAGNPGTTQSEHKRQEVAPANTVRPDPSRLDAPHRRRKQPVARRIAFIRSILPAEFY